jgi:penicillin-insensitive murein endopeptidase
MIGRASLFTVIFGFIFACQSRSTSIADYPNSHSIATSSKSDSITKALEGNDSKEAPGTRTIDETSSNNDEFDEAPNDDGEDVEIESEAPSDLVNVSKHPLVLLSDQELELRLKENPTSLGSASLGKPNNGRLFNAIRMPEDEAWKLVDPNHAFGTEETVQELRLALRAVYDQFPNTPAVSIGHLSAAKGGPLSPHRSHQSGRDVDLSFYYDGAPNRWYQRANSSNLDLRRTVFLIQTLIEKTHIEMILVDQSLHEPLKRFALEQGLAPDWVESWFSRRLSRGPVVRHAPGHATHLHLRFKNPIAERSGQRLASLLDKHHLVPLPPKTVNHVARAGDTLAKLAQRYGTSMHAIRVQNSMKTLQLVAGRTYQIPVKPTSQSPTASPMRASTASTRRSGGPR